MDYNRKNPYMAKVVDSYIISEGSGKETNHYVFSIKGSGIRYKSGDAMGLFPKNNEELVKSTIRKLRAKRRDKVSTGDVKETTLEKALLHRFVIHRAGKKFLAMVHGKMGKGKPKRELEAILNEPEALEKYLFVRDYIDVMNEYKVKISPQEFIDTLSPIAPRLYSISSSPKAHLGEIHLTVAIVKYNNLDRDRYGLATGDLARDITVNETEVPIYIQPTRDFVIPKNGTKDIIMVGPGTGIAPFRAFMEERVSTGATGKNWLFFGEVHEETTFFYRDEWFDYMQKGKLTKLTTAFSRDQKEKIYVQNRITSNGKEIWNWLQNGAYFFICGDKQYMAKDVHKALIQIAEEHGKMKKEDAEHYINQTLMKEEHRYLRDVY